MTLSSDSHYEDVSLINFFLDRDIIPIEITFDRDQSISQLYDIFESLKSRIGSPRNYGLTKSEQEEIHKLKMEIERKQAEKKSEDARQKALEELEKKEETIKDWVSLIKFILAPANFLKLKDAENAGTETIGSCRNRKRVIAHTSLSDEIHLTKYYSGTHRSRLNQTKKCYRLLSKVHD